MKKRIISERYASALLNFAKKKEAAGQVFENLEFIKKMLSENASLRIFLESPHITQEDKMSFIKKAFGDSVTETAMTFLMILVRKYRLKFLGEIIDEYERLYDIERAVQKTDVITAYPLDDTAVARLRTAVESSMKKSIKMCLIVDPDILGGVVIRTPNLIIDGSLRRKLNDLSSSITSLRV